MAREIQAGQRERFASPNITPVTLAVVTFYSDRVNETIDSQLFLATLPITYDYGNVGVWRVFEPLIAGGDDFLTEITHLPRPEPTASLTPNYRLHCANKAINGVRLFDLFPENNTHGAKIEVSQLLLADADLNTNRGPIQLLTYVGDEHTVLFRGVVTRLSNISLDSFTIESEVETRYIPTPWKYATDPSTTDPLDLGKRYPFVYGRAYKVPAINETVGWVTTLVEDINSTETGTGYKVTDGSGFPTGSFTARIDGEEMTCSAGAATTITIGTRGTPASAHYAGAVITEILSSTVLVLNGYSSTAVNALYVENPMNDQLVRLDPAASYWPTINLGGITTATFSATKLSDLMDALRTQADPAGAITTQPEFTDPLTEMRINMVTQKAATGGVNDNNDLPYGNSEFATFSNYVAIYGGWRIESTSSSADEDGRWFWIPTGLLSYTSRSIYRFRFVAVVDYQADSGAALDFWFNWDFAGETGATYNRISAGASSVDGTTFVSDWEYPTSMTIADLERSSTPSTGSLAETLCVYINPAGSPNGNGYIDIRSIELVVELVDANLTRDTDVAATTGAATGFGLRFYADLDGVPAPSVSSAYVTAEDFETGTWTGDNCTTALSSAYPEAGTYALALTWDADAEALSEPFDTDVADGWGGTNCEASLVTGEGHRVATSTAAVEGAATNATANAVLYWDTFAVATVEDFESGTWNVLNGSAAISATNPKTGTNSLAVTFDVDAQSINQLVQTDSLTGWTDGGPTTLSVETGLGHLEGTGCIKAVTTGGTAVHSITSPTFSAKNISAEAADGSGKIGVAVDIRVNFGTDPDPADLEFGFNDSTGYRSQHLKIPASAFTNDAWHTVVFSYDSYYHRDSSFDPTDVREIWIVFARVAPAGVWIAVDNIRWLRMNTVVQNNTIGGVDMTADGDAYSIQYYCGGDVRREPEWYWIKHSDQWMKAWISSATTWSGTTLGTDYWMLPIDPDPSIRSDWQEIAAGTYQPGGTLTVSNVNAMRIQIRNQDGLYDRDPVLVHYLDDFGAASLLTGPSADFLSQNTWDRGERMIMFDFKIKKGGSDGVITFRLGNSADVYWESGSRFTTNDFTEDTWVTVVYPPRFWSVYPPGSNIVSSDINYFAVEFNQGPTRSATAKVYLDNVKIVNRNSIAQNNAVGGKDYSTYNYSYRMTCYPEADHADGHAVKMLLSSDNWTATDIGADYFRGTFDFYDAANSWNYTFIAGGTMIGDGCDLANINTNRFVAVNSIGIFSRDPVSIHHIDTLRTNVPEITYHATSGNVMLHPSDIIQHWITVVGGQEVMPNAPQALVNNLGTGAIWGFDTRTLGFTWDEVLQRMAFEARANVVPLNTPAGLRWQLLVANGTYGFGEGIATLTETHSAIDYGHDVNSVANQFKFLYAFDASYPGNGSDSGFRGVLSADYITSDVPISTAAISESRTRYGSIAADPVAFRCIWDSATAEEIAGYYVQEWIMSYPHRVVTLGNVAWFDAMPLEVGDVVLIQLPWRNSPERYRITSMRKAFAEQTWTITAVSVRYTGQKT